MIIKIDITNDKISARGGLPLFLRYIEKTRLYDVISGTILLLFHLCTNTKLSFIKMIEIYQIRWTIEVFFKEAKQLLGLGRCQSNSFDAQVADTTIAMVQHILLTMRYRVDHYESMMGLFSSVKYAAVEQRLDQRLWGLFIELIQIVAIMFEDIDEQELLEKIFQNEKVRQIVNHIITGGTSQIEKAA